MKRKSNPVRPFVLPESLRGSGEKSTRILVSSKQASVECSVIHIWNRADLADNNPDDGPFKMRDAGTIIFNAAPLLARVAYLWSGRVMFFLVCDGRGQWYDVSANRVSVQLIEGDRALWDGSQGQTKENPA